MARDNTGLHTTEYACKCLNVRIIVSEPSSGPPEYPRDDKYTPVFVKDDGISVIHPQVTVRVASKAEPISGTSRYSRFMAVTCLFCNLPVYRVHQTISLEVEGNESTLLPTEEWVEQEILKTATGWIDVHKDSIVGENISKAESSSSYAAYFSLLLPPIPSPPLTSEEEFTPVVRKPSPEEPPPAYLSDLPPLFLLPPFTPSHPIFVHLAGIASQQSQELRAAAEQRISDFVKAETAGIEIRELEFKSQVESLWTNFKQHVSAIQQERSQSNNLARSPSRIKDGDKFSANGVVSSSQLPSSVTIRSFVPQVVSPAPLVLSGSIPRVSGLSASLATSGFYHPRETLPETSSASIRHGSSPSTLSTSRSGSSTLVHPPLRTAGVSIQEYKPNINDDINTQASYRYLVNLDEDMARYKRTQEEALKKQREATKDTQRAGTSQVQSGFSPNGIAKSRKLQTEESMSGEGSSKVEEETTPSRGREKGKRRVTFDVEPAVVNTQSDGESTEGEASGQFDSREMIFPIEDLESLEESKAENPTNEQQSTLPLLELGSRLLRPRTSRPNAGLEAFAALRPASLPNPSHIRPMRSQPGVDSSSQAMLISRVPASVVQNEISSRTASTSSTPLNEYDAAILKLVAADTPSHRGAWAPESKAWQAFTRRKDSKDNLPLKKTTNIPDEQDGDEATSSKAVPDAPAEPAGTKPRAVQFAPKLRVMQYEADEEDDEGNMKYRGIPGSMPIDIMKPKVKEPLTLASYAVPAPIPEQVPATVSPSPGSAGKPLSATAIRKAAYAERDRNRAMDPGALDFAVHEDEDNEEEGDGDGDGETNHARTDMPDAGEKARKQALRILQARSELPEEGMWRSLA